ncbi:hypothetical protein [Gelria sp. Kuro-4]|uniref:hypothetical protein n=1 Tax=Gelria sp. Kuro-4 TaxID=2796927 RepID=UPI001BEDC8F8|nr:hypothetical protein [Gelria sp. Kuro-4]BCV26040.1 hypothetical protein kuro4_28130 [Gelria sp. Kuro-4]
MPTKPQILRREPFDCVHQLPSAGEGRLVTCEVEPSRIYLHPVAKGKVLAFGRLELVACYEKAKTPGEYQLTSVYRNFVQEIGLAPSEEATATRAEGGLQARFSENLTCMVTETGLAEERAGAPKAKTGAVFASRRYEVVIRGDIEIFILRREEQEKTALPAADTAAAEKVSLPPRPYQVPEETDAGLGPADERSPFVDKDLVPAAENIAPELHRAQRASPDYPPPPLRASGSMPRMPRVLRGAETIPPYVWRMPGRG